jgi:hypothetical protein
MDISIDLNKVTHKLKAWGWIVFKSVGKARSPLVLKTFGFDCQKVLSNNVVTIINAFYPF